MKGDRFASAAATYGEGLDGLVAGESAISTIDGRKGRLSYRGHTIESLAADQSFEAVAHLLLVGRLPDAEQLDAWRAALVAARRLPRSVTKRLEEIPPGADVMSTYRAVLAIAAARAPETAAGNPLAAAARILGWTAGIAAGAVRRSAGAPVLEPRGDGGYAEHFLALATGETPSESAARALEVSLIVQAEHGLHAAALAALVVASTGSSLESAVLAGTGALSGARHGGANVAAYEEARALADVEHARTWARERVAERYRFPGYGHRVYKCEDPRARILRAHAERLLTSGGGRDLWGRAEAVRLEVERALGPKGIYANVDAVTGFIYAPIGLPVSSFPVPFCLAIQVGWIAHVLEYGRGRVLQPRAVFIDAD